MLTQFFVFKHDAYYSSLEKQMREAFGDNADIYVMKPMTEINLPVFAHQATRIHYGRDKFGGELVFAVEKWEGD